MIAKGFTEPTARIKALKAEVVNAVPEVEPYRAVLITESYKEQKLTRRFLTIFQL